jgi:hypothetical protein
VNVLGVLAYIAAGVLLYALNLVVVFKDPALKGDPRLVMVPVFLLPATVAWIVGMALRGRSRWRRDSGIMLLAVAAFDAMVGLMVVCMLATPETRQMFRPETFSAMSDYRSFLVVLLIYLLLGSVLFFSSMRVVRPSRPVCKS